MMHVRHVFSSLGLSLILAVGAFGQEIDLPLTVSDNAGGERALYFGLDPTATDGIDPHLGESELPPFPPSGVFEARFVGTDIGVPEMGLGSYRDYREGDGAFAGEIVHQLQYQVGNGSTITVAWDFPENVIGRLQDIITGELIDVDMEAAGSFTVENPGAINKLKMTVTYEAANQPPVFESDPVTEAQVLQEYVYDVVATDPDGDQLTLSAEVLPAWLAFVNHGDGTGVLSGTPDSGDVGDHPVTLMATDGQLSTEQSFEVTVSLTLAAPELSVPADGIGSVSRRPHLRWGDVSFSETFEVEVAPGGDFDSAISFTGVVDTSLLLPEMLEAGQEYAWRVRARAAGVAGPFSGARSFTTTGDLAYGDVAVPGGDELEFTNAGVRITFTQLAEQGEVVVTRHSQEPVPPPDDLFLIGQTYWTIDFDGSDEFSADVCFALASLGETGDLAELTVLRRDHGAATWTEVDVWLDPEDEPAWLCIQTSYFSDFAVASTKAVSSDPDGAGSSAPALLGNYPNPFDSQTTILYDMPHATAVRVVVYDLLGREVAVLVDADLQAGRHEVSFSATGLGAGVYIVRLTTDAASRSRRVLVMR